MRRILVKKNTKQMQLESKRAVKDTPAVGLAIIYIVKCLDQSRDQLVLPTVSQSFRYLKGYYSIT